MVQANADGLLTARLRVALTEALSSRDLTAVSAIRSVLAAIGNAEAVAARATAQSPAGSVHFAGAAAGLGASEVPRHQLTEADIAGIVSAEIAERRSAASQYDQLGRTDRAGRLLREADVLTAILAGQPL